MTNRADIRSRIRAELGDEIAGAYVWPDDTLNQFINTAIAEYSRGIPREMTCTLSLADGTTEYDVPADLITLRSVEFPVGTFIDLDPPVSGDDLVYAEVSPRQAWWFYEGKIRFRNNPGAGTAEVCYLGLHSSLPDDVAETTAPDADVTLIVWHACDQALRWLNVQRGKQGYQGAALMDAASYRSAYLQGIADRRRRFRSVRLEVS